MSNTTFNVNFVHLTLKIENLNTSLLIFIDKLYNTTHVSIKYFNANYFSN